MGRLRAIALAVLVAWSGAARAAGDTRLLDDRLVIAPAGPWSLSGEASVGIGLFFATFAQGAVSIARRFWDRLELELSLRAGGGGALIDLEGTAGASVLLHLSRRVDVALGWRIGAAGFRATLQQQAFWVAAVTASVVGEVRIALTPRVALRVAPIVGTGYWNGIWGFVLQPALGASYRF